MNYSPVKKAMTASLCIALCVVLSETFHVIGGDGVYGAIHMPVLLCGLVCGWRYGLLCAFAGVTLSTVISGTPSLALLPALLLECVLTALIAGAVSKKFKPGENNRNVSLILLTAMLAGRLAGAVLSAAMYVAEGISPFLWAGGYLASAMPGMIVQLVLLPYVLKALGSAGLLESAAPVNPMGQDEAIATLETETRQEDEGESVVAVSSENGEE